ncbi:MAG: tRNA1(Val) (adenine(37)-N6)-methyltransferase [Treponema sp.]|nr:tRNA1(Val) (adenine(37)-N6)-methyltransferase [Treponema sp.]
MEQIDTLKNGYKIIQDTEGFMFGIDAVLLTDFVSGCIKAQDRIIDLGTGNGIIPLLLSAKNNPNGNSSTKNLITGLEIQQGAAELATRSVELNGLQNKITIINGDLTKTDDFAGKYGLAKHGFEIVTCNPPYSVVESGKQNPKDEKAIARHEVLCTLEDVVAAADFLLKPHGKFLMIHRPYRLAEIFGALYHHHLEPKRMRLVSPFAGEEPNLVLLEARKNAKPRLKLEPELAVYERAGEYTEEVKAIYSNFK